MTVKGPQTSDPGTTLNRGKADISGGKKLLKTDDFDDSRGYVRKHLYFSLEHLYFSLDRFGSGPVGSDPIGFGP